MHRNIFRKILKKGKLSPDQADAVTSGAEASPEDEDDLLASAERDPLHATRDKAARARAKADEDRLARQRRQHALRQLRRWVDEDGMHNFLLRVAPEVGADIDATLKPLIDRAFADARDAGRMESLDAYAADVVSDLLRGLHHVDERLPDRARNQAVRPDRKVIAFVDLAALNRGTVCDGEVCEIAGVGPVSVSAIRAMLSDAFVSVVIRDGVDVRNVTHLGRQATAHQRTALEARGYRCEVEGCGSTHHLDIDHVTGWTLTKKTQLEDLAWLCRSHHDRKTRENLVLVGPAKRRRLVPRTEAPPEPIQFNLAV